MKIDGCRAAAARAFFCAAACAVAACAPEPLRIGFAGSITGRQSSLGLEGKEAVELAVAEANAAGGIAGRPIELLVRDDANDPALAAAAHAELADLGAAAIVGHSTSAMMQAVFEAFPGGLRVPVVSGTVSSPDFSGKDDLFFRVINDSVLEATVGGELLRTGLGDGSNAADVLVAVYDVSNESYSRRYADAIVLAFSRRGGRASSLPFDSTASPSFRAVAEEILRRTAGSGPAAVAIAAGGVDTALVAQALRKTGFAGPLLSSAWGKTPDVVINGGEAVEGMLFFENYDASNRSDRYLAFAAEFSRRYGRPPNFSAVNHYEAAAFVLEGLRRAGPRGDLAKALRSIRSIRGLQVDIEIDDSGDAKRPLILLEARDGAFVAAGRE